MEATNSQPVVRLLDFNGNLKTAVSLPAGMEFTYDSASRAIAIFDKVPSKAELDGASIPFTGATLNLPRGRHKVTLTVLPAASPETP